MKPGTNPPVLGPASRLLCLVLIGCAGLTAAACGEPGHPALSNLRFNGQAQDSPLVLLLSFDFRDDDGDLSEGVLETFINQRATSAGPLPLLPLFLTSGLDDDATSGTIDFVLELSFTDEPPASGTTFALGARASDAQNNTSSTQEIRLRLDLPAEE